MPWRLLAFWIALEAGAQTYSIATIAGSDWVGDGGPALLALLGQAEGVALDAAGNLYIADAVDHRVRKVAPDGIITTLAGNGHAGLAGDNGPASAAQLNSPYGLATDAAGNLYIADFGNNRVRKVTPDGTIVTIGGDSASIRGPRNLAVDAAGNVYVSAFLDHRVYQITPLGQLNLVAGTGVRGREGDGASAVLAQLAAPAGLALDRDGALYIADSGNRRIRKVGAGTIYTVTLAMPLSNPTGIACDRLGNLYVADGGYIVAPGGILPFRARDIAVDDVGALYVAAGGPQVSKVARNGTAVPVAGSAAPFRYAGDGRLADRVRFNSPRGVALDPDGTLYVSDSGNSRVRRVLPSREVATITPLGSVFSPAGLVSDGVGILWFADPQGGRVRRLAAGIMTSVAGTGSPGYNGEGPATFAQLNFPGDIARDRDGNLYIADTNNHMVRKVSANGSISTIAGRGLRGYSGNGGPAVLAMLDSPSSVAVDGEGAVYIADRANHAVRKVSGGIISTVAGTGVRGFSGDYGPASKAQLTYPGGIALDPAGNLYIADTENNRIRVVTRDGVIRTIAGDGTQGFGGDGGPALSAQLALPADVAVDAAGNVFVADQDNHRVRRLRRIEETVPPPALTAVLVVNAASLSDGPVVPGEIISIFADNIGPLEPVTARLTAAGVLDNALADTRVLFDGRPAALFHVQANQINAQAPYGIAGQRETEIEVVHQAKSQVKVSVPVAEAAPGLFTMDGLVVALNEDSTLNSPENPALRGSIVTLFATGEGLTTPAAVDGRPAAAPLPKPVLPVGLRIAGYEAEILYAGSAPGLAGVLQINARVPSGFAPFGLLPVELTVGRALSQPGAMIAVR